MNYAESDFGSLPHSEISAVIENNKYIFDSSLVNSDDRYVGNVYTATSESICTVEDLQLQLETLLLGRAISFNLI